MTRAFVLHPVTTQKGRDGRVERPARAPENRLREALGLTEALGVEIAGAETTPLPSMRAATLLGPGKVDELGARFAEAEVDVVVMDAALTPLQQRNLERAWKVKVLDRTGLILEIFGDRAATKEGVLQVELAHLEYQKSRLVRSWTHLERQRGGVGFMGGPGETQIESDRRQLAEKIARLKVKLEKVAKMRGLHRAKRSKAPVPVVALVGYTNAGKSTLFNRVAQAGVMAKDMLFATLDPTMRAVRLPGGTEAILSDTVGFISELPTELVAAFRATLEEVLAADIVIHVRDVSDPETEAQRADVLAVLRDLGLDDAALEAVLEARNKIDRLDPLERRAAENAALRDADAVCLSAATGEGVDALLREIERRLTIDAETVTLVLGPQHAAAAAWLHANGLVLDAGPPDADGVSRVAARLSPLDRGRFEKRFGEVAAFCDPSEPRAAAAQ